MAACAECARNNHTRCRTLYNAEGERRPVVIKSFCTCQHRISPEPRVSPENE